MSWTQWLKIKRKHTNIPPDLDGSIEKIFIPIYSLSEEGLSIQLGWCSHTGPAMWQVYTKQNQYKPALCWIQFVFGMYSLISPLMWGKNWDFLRDIQIRFWELSIDGGETVGPNVVAHMTIQKDQLSHIEDFF